MFTFLNNFQIENNETRSNTTTSKGGAKIERNPTNGAHLRVFKDGKVFPSAAAVETFNLEYTNSVLKGGNGFDITESLRWANTKNNPNGFLMINAVPRTEGKVDLFGSVGFYGPTDELPTGKNLGDARSSVLEQGPATFGKKLIEMLRETYNLTVTEEVDQLFGTSNFVDLFIATSEAITLPDGIYYLPKQYSKDGTVGKKGEWTTVRRENITMFPLVVFKPEYITVVEEAPFTESVEATVEETELSEVQ